MSLPTNPTPDLGRGSGDSEGLTGEDV
jgi:hypothetical protein